MGSASVLCSPPRSFSLEGVASRQRLYPRRQRASLQIFAAGVPSPCARHSGPYTGSAHTLSRTASRFGAWSGSVNHAGHSAMARKTSAMVRLSPQTKPEGESAASSVAAPCCTVATADATTAGSPAGSVVKRSLWKMRPIAWSAHSGSRQLDSRGSWGSRAGAHRCRRSGAGGRRRLTTCHDQRQVAARINRTNSPKQ